MCRTNDEKFIQVNEMQHMTLITTKKMDSQIEKKPGEFQAGFVTRGLYYKHILTIASDACSINVSLVFALALASVINYACK